MKIKFTGERLIPELNQNTAFFYEHVIRYLFASQFSENKTVLDAGCGTGYGSYIIDKFGKPNKIQAVDISNEAINYAKEKYQTNTIIFFNEDVTKLKLIKDKTIDLAVNFEVIEHITDQKKFLRNIKRVLKDNGLLVISTPNVLTYPGNNKYHVKELSPKDFKKILQSYFKNIVFLSQNYHITESIDIYNNDDEYIKTIGNFQKIKQLNYIEKNNDKNAEYLVAICSDKKIPKINFTSISPLKVDFLDFTQGISSVSKMFYKLNQELEKQHKILSKLKRENKIKIDTLNRNNQDLSLQLNNITSSKTFKLWQKFCSLKKKLIILMKLTKKLTIATIYFITLLIFFLFSLIIRLFTSLFSQKITISNNENKIDGVSFIIPTWNKKDMVVTCIKLLDKHLSLEKPNIKKEIIIIENGSTDGTAEAIENLKTNTPVVLLRQNTNLGYAKAVNLGVEKSKYNYVYLLNNDMEVQNNFFTSLINYAQELISNNKQFFGIASQIFFYDKTKRREESGKTSIQPNFGNINVFHYTFQDTLNDNSYTLYPGGGSSLINKHYFNVLGGYDYKSYTPLYCEDLDLGFNAWKLGLPSYYCAKSHVIHHHRSSSKLLSIDPNYYMYKNWTVFCLKNFDSLNNILRHTFLYPLQILKDNNHKKYAIEALSNIQNIFISKIKLYKYKQVHSDESLINFPLFETRL